MMTKLERLCFNDRNSFRKIEICFLDINNDGDIRKREVLRIFGAIKY